MKFFKHTAILPFAFVYSVIAAGAIQNTVLLPETPIAAPVNKNTPNSSKTELMPPLAPARNNSTNFTSAPAVSPEVEDDYPLIGKMETITFGKSKPSELVDERLSALEKVVFCTTYPSMSLYDRTQKLKITILGPVEPAKEESNDLGNSPMLTPLLNSTTANIGVAKPQETYFELVAKDAENQKSVPANELPGFALQLINSAREQMNFPPLAMDDIAERMAEEHIADLRKRGVISHVSEHGENPDLRYTTLGGNGAIVESIIGLKPELIKDKQYTHALVAHALKLLVDRQDDREALLARDATGFGFSLDFMPGQKAAIACVEVSTSHGTINSVALPLKVGDKVEISGNIESPYRFSKITVAWEGAAPLPPEAVDEKEEALPYFPPLDYVGYAHKSEHDYGAAKTALKIGCLAGIVAGSLFMPPVALAAPLVMMAPGTGPSDPKPMSDIPLHSGVKIDGSSFARNVTISNAGKPGIYYVTVWATTGESSKPIPISRRAFLITEKNEEALKQVTKENKHKKSDPGQ